jgi:hypothetical protein
MGSIPSREVASSRFEIIKGLEGFVAEHLDSLLKPVNESWQPSDFLPEPSHQNWMHELQELRKGAEGLPEEGICPARLPGTKVEPPR